MNNAGKEPLVHFLGIGALLFLLYGMVNTEVEMEEIVIDNALVSELVAKWELKRDRQPNLNELRGMVDEYITQEVFYREALAMNLDHNDEIVKRRLAQKMEFISDDLAQSLQPTEEVLQSYYEHNKQHYVKAPSYTLTQVFFDKSKRTDANLDARKALLMDDPSTVGDQIFIPKKYQMTSADKLARDFGSSFIMALDTLPIGQWTGPIRSGIGIHLVKIDQKVPGDYYTYEQVANRVSTDYNFEASRNFKQELIKTLLKKYTLTFDLASDTLNLNRYEE